MRTAVVPEWVVAHTDQSDADVQIACLRSRQPRMDMDRDVAGAQIETLRSPPTLSTPTWARIIHPIMCAATAFTLHTSGITIPQPVLLPEDEIYK